MSTSSYLVGALFLALVLGSAAVAAWIIVQRQGARLDGPLARALAWAVLAAAGIFASHLLPGALGILSRYTVAAASVLLAGIVSLVVPGQARTRSGQTAGRSRATEPWLTFGLAAAVITSVYLLAAFLHHATAAVTGPDIETFHLPNVARWIQTGSLWGVHDFVPNRAPGDYPQTGDLYLLAAVLPWKADFLARFVAVPFLGLLAAAVYAAGRELGASRSPSLLAAAALVAMPAVGSIAVSGLVDIEMLAAFAAGGYFLLRRRRTGDRFDLVCAGVALGLSLGTRWYAVPAVVAAIAVWLLGPPLVRRWLGSPAPSRRQLAGLVALVAVFGAFWLIRNWVESGNPVFPVKVAPLGITIWNAPPDIFRERQGFTLAHYLGDPGILRAYFWHPFLGFMSWGSVALWVLAAAAGVVGVREVRRGEAAWSGPLALIAAAAVIGIVYVFTPYTGTGPAGHPVFAVVNARYVIPALVAAGPAIAFLITRSASLRPILELLLFGGACDGVRRSVDGGLSSVSAASVGAAVAVAAAGAAGWLWWRQRARRPPRRAWALGAAAAAAATVALGGLLEHRLYEHRYGGTNAAIDYVSAAAPSGARVGLVGEGWANYPLFGPRLGNHVAYIGPRVDGMLRSYRRRRAFDRAVGRGRYELVYAQDADAIHPGLPARQVGWLRQLGFRVVSGPSSFGTQAPSLLAAPGSRFRASA